MSGERYLTRNHKRIRRWAEARKGKPAAVKETGSDSDPGIIRIDFPGYSGKESLERIDWDTWFQKFDSNDLVLLFQETTSGGEDSNFNKLIDSETAEEAASNAHWVEAEGAEEEE